MWNPHIPNCINFYNINILSQKEYLEQGNEIKQKRTGWNKFDICFYVNCGCYGQGYIPGREARGGELSPLNF